LRVRLFLLKRWCELELQANAEPDDAVAGVGAAWGGSAGNLKKFRRAKTVNLSPGLACVAAFEGEGMAEL
jgi:hypothetical protein